LLNETYVEGGLLGDMTKSTDLKFTGRIYIYSEDPISHENIKYIEERSKEMGHDVRFEWKSMRPSGLNLRSLLPLFRTTREINN